MIANQEIKFRLSFALSHVKSMKGPMMSKYNLNSNKYFRTTK